MTTSRPGLAAALPVFAVSILAAASGSAQVPRDRPAARIVDPDAAALGRGWTALGSGRRDAAAEAADEILRRDPRHHAAAELKIEALSHEPARALDAYEFWVAQGPEDMFLLGTVARAELRRTAEGSDRGLQVQALQRLASAGDAAAARALDGLHTTLGSTADLLRAREGDVQAAKRLLGDSDAGGVRPEALAEALPAAGLAAVPKLLDLLHHPAPPVRSAAALALGRVGAAEALDPLKDVMAKDQMTRSAAAVALARLGDPEAKTVVSDMLQSDVPDVRLLAAEAYPREGQGPWVDALLPLLQDPNGLTRIRAAELLVGVQPERARAVLEEAAGDPNPVVRSDVARVLEAAHDVLGPSDESVPRLRRLLRDPDPSVRTHAAGALLKLLRRA